jgi:hypothetical protein
MMDDGVAWCGAEETRSPGASVFKAGFQVQWQARTGTDPRRVDLGSFGLPSVFDRASR